MSDLPTREETSIIFKGSLDQGKIVIAYVGGHLKTETEWREDLNYLRFARWLYNFTSPTGPMSVVSWEGLSQVRRDQWIDRIRHGLDDKLNLSKQS